MEDSDKPSLRRAVRAHLAERPSVSQSAATVHRHVGAEYGASVAEVESACGVLVSMGQLSSHHDPLGGSVKYYKATADGILAHERGE